MTDLELAWLAGLLEGEGSFMVHWKASTTGDKYPAFRVQCNMTDEDIIQRAHSLIPGSTFNKNSKIPAGNRKQVYTFGLNRREELKWLLLSLLPFMGERRSRKIKKLLYLMEVRYRPKWRRGTRQGYEFRGCRCDKCRASNAKRHRAARARRAGKAPSNAHSPLSPQHYPSSPDGTLG